METKVEKNNIFVKTILFVVLAIILTVGVTYAYFRATITGVESVSTISIGGATLKIVYEGTETINEENIIPGWSSKKYFNIDVTNTSRKDISYDINLVVLNSNFYTTNASGNSYLEYALYECSSEADTTCETVIKSSSVLDIQSGDKLVYTTTTNTSVKTYYALELSFPNQDAVQNQKGTNDQPLTFSGYVTIESGGELYVRSFADDDWATIAANVRGNPNVYSVGSEKEVKIDIDGDRNAESYKVRIANNSNYDCKDDSGNTLESETACGFVVEFVDIVEKRAMNSNNTNVGGWPATEMYQYLNGTYDSDAKTWNRTNTLYSNLPKDLQDVIIDTTVVSGHGPSDRYSKRDDGNWESTDKIYLLSTGEIWSNCTTGNCYDTASYQNGATTTRQLDYYSSKSVSTTSNYSKSIKNYNGSAIWWWLRAPVSSLDTYFSYATSEGKLLYDIAKSTHGGVAPAFRIG